MTCKVLFLGVPGSGKTTFMYALLYDMMTNAEKYGILHFNHNDLIIKIERTLAKVKNGKQLKKILLESLINKLEFEFLYKKEKKKVSFSVKDWNWDMRIMDRDYISGIALDDMKDKYTRKLLKELKKYQIFLISYDPARSAMDFLKQNRIIVRALLYIIESHKSSGIRALLNRVRKINNIAVGIVITKGDLKPEILSDPMGWISARDLIYLFCRRHLKYCKVFGTFVYGEAKLVETGKWVPKGDIFKPVGTYDVITWLKEVVQKLKC